MWPPVFAALLALWIVFGPGGTAIAENFTSLGYHEDTVIQTDGRDECVGTLVYNHDYSFENGYCWFDEGVAPPYYGAWAEGYDLGPVTVECGIYWFTQIGYPVPPPTDIYVWDGGAHGPPGSVLCMVPGVTDLCIGYWPSCCENDIEIGCCVSDDFAVGYWVDLQGYCVYYCCADESGSEGHPWTCIAPGLGYPTGWNHPNVVFPDCASMGIGVTVTEDPSPAESDTWGAIKSLYQR